MADKIGRHYSGTWSGKVNRDTSSLPGKPQGGPTDFKHHMDHPNATHKQMKASPKGDPMPDSPGSSDASQKSMDDKLKALDAEVSGRL